MNLSVILTVLLGLASVLQAGLNRKLAAQGGIMGATVLNNFILLAASVLGLFILANFKGTDGVGTKFIDLLRNFRLWFFIPGILGLGLVAGIPYLMGQMGAVQVFVILVTSQIVSSMAWDFLVEGQTLSILRLSGCALTLAGAVLVAMAQKSS